MFVIKYNDSTNKHTILDNWDRDEITIFELFSVNQKYIKPLIELFNGVVILNVRGIPNITFENNVNVEAALEWINAMELAEKLLEG